MRNMRRTFKSHGSEVEIADVRVPTISDRDHRVRTLTVRGPVAGMAAVVHLHPRAIRKLARDVAALAARLPRR